MLSAFADEIAPELDRQTDGLKKLGINMIELRGVDGKSFTALSDEEVLDAAEKLRKAKITVSSLGSPIGKMAPDGDFEEHMALFARVMDIGELLGDVYPVHRIRFFSFYKAPGQTDASFESETFRRIERILKEAERRGFIMCHENEKDIYGDSVEHVFRLAEHFGGRLRLALDNGNFAFCHMESADAWERLGKYVEYLHIKDADSDGVIVPAGCGTAHIGELIESVKHDGRKEMILTVEPHLCDFCGLASLARDGALEHKYSFDSPFEAFSFATEEIRKMINTHI